MKLERKVIKIGIGETSICYLAQTWKVSFLVSQQKRSARIVREQVEKSKMIWENVDPKWLCLYVYLNKKYCEGIKEIEHLLPKRTPGRRVKEAGMGSWEARRREVRESGEGNWIWPEKLPKEKETRKLLGMALEIAVQLNFTNFIYTFGGKSSYKVQGPNRSEADCVCV